MVQQAELSSHWRLVAVAAAGCLCVAHHDGDGSAQLRYAVYFRNDEIGKAGSRRRADQRDILLEIRTAYIMHARTDTAMLIVSAGDQVCDQLRMRGFIAGSSAVFTVKGDIEYGAHLLLQGHRLMHQFFRARIVVAGRNRNRLLRTLKQNLGRMHEGGEWNLVEC